MKKFEEYLKDYIYFLGKRHLPNEDYQIVIVHNNKMDEFFNRFNIKDNCRRELKEESDTFGFTFFVKTKEMFKKMNYKVGYSCIFIDKLLKTAKYYEGYNIMRHVKSTVLHECRHCQQFNYILERNDLKIKDSSEIMYIENENIAYEDQTIEIDAKYYAYTYTIASLEEDIIKVPLEKVYNKLIQIKEKIVI